LGLKSQKCCHHQSSHQEISNKFLEDRNQWSARQTRPQHPGMLLFSYIWMCWFIRAFRLWKSSCPTSPTCFVRLAISSPFQDADVEFAVLLDRSIAICGEDNRPIGEYHLKITHRWKRMAYLSSGDSCSSLK
jgi:hypothetical protein